MENNLLKISCIMCMPSHYQADFYRELNKLCDLTVYYENKLPEDRIELGWKADITGINYKYLDVQGDKIMDKQGFYFISGLPGSYRNLKLLLSKNYSDIAFQSEMTGSTDRKFHHSILRRIFKVILNSKDVPLLSIGEEIRKYFLNLGLKQELIFPYAYFSQKSNLNKADFFGPIVYIGQLIKRKQVDLLIKAYNESKIKGDRDLWIIGSGEENESLISLVNNLGLSKKVKFWGSVDSTLINEKLNGCSGLILPSIFDGWGVVVNEGLNSNLPVIVSDGCGSKELIENNDAGFIFDRTSIGSLTEKINLLYESKDKWEHYSISTLDVSEKISPRSGAEYFIKIVNYLKNSYEGDRPVAPWLLH